MTRDRESDDLAQRVQRLVESETYRLAPNDPDFLEHDDLRAVRLQLEYLKPEWTMRQQGIRSTVIVFGSARLRGAEDLERDITVVQQELENSSDKESLALKLRTLKTRRKYVKYYDEARKFSTIVSQKFEEEGHRDFVVVTGGGPGIMEAANRGAWDVGARSVGLNIDLPREQDPNPYISPELCLQFRYFALRKMHFFIRARALVAFPGGFGTLDELFEILTLIQTKKGHALPIVLIGAEYWSRVVDFEFLAQEGFISRDDLNLFHIVDTAEDAVALISDFYEGKPPV
ncbi:MAG: TIGR00730 family Rossman fold protein [Alphaproteobacteria bacterium]|nr:TIGR00730 family Rossman fold protein [Alphaproteobacteria bacterium]